MSADDTQWRRRFLGGLALEWDQSANKGSGAYCVPRKLQASAVSSTTFLPAPVPKDQVVPQLEWSVDRSEAGIFDRKLRAAANEGAFLALTVAPSRLRVAEAKLAERFPVQRCNVDQFVIESLREEAARVGVKWEVVCRADRASHQSREWRNLMMLLDRALPRVEAALSASDQTVLAVNTGLLARYDRIHLIEKLRERIGYTGAPVFGLWLLLPTDEQSPYPFINDKPLPVIGSGQWARVPESWIM